MLVCAPGHRLAQRERVTLEDLHGLEMIAFDADLEIRHEIDRALAAPRRRSPRGDGVRQYGDDQAGRRDRRGREPAAAADRRSRGRGRGAGRPAAGGIELKRPIGIIQRRGAKSWARRPAASCNLCSKQPVAFAARSRRLDEHGQPQGPTRPNRPVATKQTCLSTARTREPRDACGFVSCSAPRSHARWLRGDRVCAGCIAMTHRIRKRTAQEARAVRPGLREG